MQCFLCKKTKKLSQYQKLVQVQFIFKNLTSYVTFLLIQYGSTIYSTDRFWHFLFPAESIMNYCKGDHV